MYKRQDASIDLYDGTSQAIIKINAVTGFDAKQMTKRIDVRPLDGPPRFLELPQGWEGTLEVERADGVLDDWIASLETAYYSGGNVAAASITQTITEPDGTTKQYRFDKAVFKLTDAGSWKADASVKMKLDWAASTRKRVV